MRVLMMSCLALLAGCGSSPADYPGGPRQAPSPLLSEAPPPSVGASAVPTDGATGTPPDGGRGPMVGMVTRNTAVITNTGSTNATGYRILVGANGSATYQTPTASGSAQLPMDLYQGFFNDIKAAGSLSQLPEGQCAKSASFGTSVTVQLGGQTSPDLSCPGNAAAQAIAQDVQRIVEALAVPVGTPQPGQPNVPVMNY